MADLRAKGDDRYAVIAQLRAEPRRNRGLGRRHVHGASHQAELASYKDAEQRAALLEETVASQAEEIRRLSEAAARQLPTRPRLKGAGRRPVCRRAAGRRRRSGPTQETNRGARGQRRVGSISRPLRVLNCSDVSRPWKKRTQMPQMPWRRPTNASRRSAPRARPTRRPTSKPATNGRHPDGSAGAAEADVELFEDDERIV